ncbi:MAG: hypothetical protein ABI380_00680 [Edaphobacter sp.]
MDRAALKQTADGGYIEKYRFDINSNAFIINIDVLDADILSTYEVRFENLSRFLFESESRGIKDRLELTEMWIDETPEASSSEEWAVTISMWDMTHISLRCASIVVDDAPLR